MGGYDPRIGGFAGAIGRARTPRAGRGESQGELLKKEGKEKREVAPAAKPKELPTLSFADAAAWSKWLTSHHASSPGIWMKIAKKGSKAASIGYADAIEVALAWGWIDGQKRALDASWWLQRFSCRGAGEHSGPRSTARRRRL